jgi:hypothetical protein
MAEISGITARIGEGKSLWMTLQIARTLKKSDRLIVTDLPLVLENATGRLWTWSEWAQKFVDRALDINKRLCVISYEQSREFWRCLPAQAYDEKYVAENLESGAIKIVENTWPFGSSKIIWLPEMPNVVFKKVGDFRFRTGDVRGMRGVDYFIDEAHKKFPPLYYQTYGAACDWYMSELRRLDDNLSWASQHPEKVDKNFRRLTTEWWQVQNMSKNPLFMGVTLKGRFRYHWYSQNEMPTRLDKPTASGWFSFDKKERVHDLYDTMQTSSMAGNAVLHEQKFNGRSPVVWVIALVAIVFCAWFGPRALQYAVQKGVGSVVGGFQKGVQKGTAGLMPAPGVAPVVARPAAPAQIVPLVLPAALSASAASTPAPRFNAHAPASGVPEGVEVIGTSGSPGNWTVMLNNGMILRPVEVADVGQRYVLLADGDRVPIHGKTFATSSVKKSHPVDQPVTGMNPNIRLMSDN